MPPSTVQYLLYQKNPQTTTSTLVQVEVNLYSKRLKDTGAQLTSCPPSRTQPHNAIDERLRDQAVQSATLMLKLFHLSKSMSDFANRLRGRCHTRRIQETRTSACHSKSLGQRSEGQLQGLNRCIKKYSSCWYSSDLSR